MGGTLEGPIGNALGGGPALRDVQRGAAGGNNCGRTRGDSKGDATREAVLEEEYKKEQDVMLDEKEKE